jgi:hypothetical protein
VEVDAGGVGECPICGLELRGIGVSVNEHVSSCLDSQTQEEEDEEEEEEGGGNWDVYTFGGQTRVRAIGLLEGGVRSLPDAVVHIDDGNGVDVFVDIEGDTDAVYGQPQYTEADLINPDAAAKNTKPSGGSLVNPC